MSDNVDDYLTGCHEDDKQIIMICLHALILYLLLILSAANFIV
jgi:hypothetical protein